MLVLIGSTTALKHHWLLLERPKNQQQIPGPGMCLVDLGCLLCDWTHVAWQGLHLVRKAGVGEKWMCQKWLNNETNNIKKCNVRNCYSEWPSKLLDRVQFDISRKTSDLMEWCRCSNTRIRCQHECYPGSMCIIRNAKIEHETHWYDNQ